MIPMVISVATKCSIYRKKVVLRKTIKNFIIIECGMDYHTPKTIIPYQPPSPLNFNSKSTKIVSLYTDIKWARTDTVLKQPTTSTFRQTAENTGSIFPWNTATQTTWYPNLVHTVSSSLSELEVKHHKKMTKVWMHHDGKTNLQYIMSFTNTIFKATVFWTTSMFSFTYFLT